MAFQHDDERPRVGVAEAKAKFAELLKRAEAGETIGITRHGRTVAMLTPPARPDSLRSVRGIWAGRGFWIADDFDVLGPEWDEYVK